MLSDLAQSHSLPRRQRCEALLFEWTAFLGKAHDGFLLMGVPRFLASTHLEIKWRGRICTHLLRTKKHFLLTSASCRVPFFYIFVITCEIFLTFLSHSSYPSVSVIDLSTWISCLLSHKIE